MEAVPSGEPPFHEIGAYFCGKGNGEGGFPGMDLTVDQVVDGIEVTVKDDEKMGRHHQFPVPVGETGDVSTPAPVGVGYAPFDLADCFVDDLVFGPVMEQSGNLTVDGRPFVGKRIGQDCISDRREEFPFIGSQSIFPGHGYASSVFEFEVTIYVYMKIMKWQYEP
jgi:hypothetical protein